MLFAENGFLQKMERINSGFKTSDLKTRYYFIGVIGKTFDRLTIWMCIIHWIVFLIPLHIYKRNSFRGLGIKQYFIRTCIYIVAHKKNTPKWFQIDSKFNRTKENQLNGTFFRNQKIIRKHQPKNGIFFSYFENSFFP